MDKFLHDLIEDPYTAAHNFYQISPAGQITSNYLPINDKQLCCLVHGQDCNQVKEAVTIINKGKIGIPYILTLIDDTQIVIKLMNVHPHASYSDNPIAHKAITSKCLGHVDGLTFFGTDVFTNEILIAYFLRIVFKNSSLSGVIRHNAAGLCHLPVTGWIGIDVMEYANLGSIATLPQSETFQEMDTMRTVSIDNFDNNIDHRVFTVDTVLNIVKQIVTTYDYLVEYADFNHSDAKVANALAVNEPIKYEYKGLQVNSPFTIKIADFDKASLTIKIGEHWFRFYNKSKFAARYFKLFPYQPELGVHDGRTYYKTDTTFSAQLYAQSRHTGLPFYHSYDIYTFLVSLFMMPEVFYAMLDSIELQVKIWNVLWFPEDASKMFIAIQDAVRNGREPSFSNVVNIVSKARLKCEISSELIESLKYQIN